MADLRSPKAPRSPAESAIWDALRFGASTEGSPDAGERLVIAAGRLTDAEWQALPAEADAHGLAPLFLLNARRAGCSLPSSTERQLATLATEQRLRSRAQLRALGEILDALDTARIPALVLKGAALVHVLYPDAGLRPFGDLDLLVAPEAVDQAQAVLRELGFVEAKWATPEQRASHHHAPGMTRLDSGVPIVVELHTDALSRDTRASLSMASTTGPLQTFTIEGRTARAFGHADMLYHLCRHAAECTDRFRLVWAADITGYAAKYRDAIPWDDVRARYPFAINALSLLHLMTPLPADMAAHVDLSDDGSLQGIGRSGRPLTRIFRRHRAPSEIWRDVMDPSDWWLRLHYGLDRRARLPWHRTVTHPMRVLFWLARRVGGARRRWSAMPDR